jgi:1-acyl-sn-glycerol-3-phosphate acyltransferase
MINRVDRRSQVECLKQCRELLAQGAPVLFFPEGKDGGGGKGLGWPDEAGG